MASEGGRAGRRGFLKDATAVTLDSIAAHGVYEVLDEAGGGPARAWAAAKRIGFLGRGFGTSRTAKTLAQAARVPGADSMPDDRRFPLVELLT
jgi:hypothetical protein